MKPEPASARAAPAASAETKETPPVLDNAVAVAVAEALGGTVAAALMVAAALGPAEAVGLALADAEAEALDSSACSMTECDSAKATGANINRANKHNEVSNNNLFIRPPF